MIRNNIFYFSNENSDQKFEKSYHARDFDKFKFITYLTQRSKSTNKIINVSWTEEAKFSESRSTSKHLESLRFLITNRNTPISTNYKKLMDSSLSVSSSGLSSLIKKLYSLIFNYPSWSIYTYPKILDIFEALSLFMSQLKLFLFDLDFISNLFKNFSGPIKRF